MGHGRRGATRVYLSRLLQERGSGRRGLGGDVKIHNRWEMSKYITAGCSQNAATYIRPPLKKILFPVQRPGVCRIGTFFFILLQFFFRYFQNFIIFLQKKQRNGKKKRFCGRPTGHNLGHPLDRKPFFKGGFS